MFEIKDNIIIGNQSPELLEKRSLQKCIFDEFTNNPETIGQVNI